MTVTKLRLDPDQLRVESYTPAENEPPARGTVRGHSFISKEWGPCSGEASAYCVETDFHWNTCGVSCWYQCLPTGPGCETE
jgi:hypothetical protein